MENNGRFSIGAAIQLRSDYTADDLRRLARSSRDAKQTRRLLALASIYEGGSRTQAARIGGVGLQIIRDWVVRFNAHGPDGLLDCKRPARRLASPMPSVPRLLRRLRPDRNLIWMASSAGGLSILSSGCVRNSAYRSAARR